MEGQKGHRPLELFGYFLRITPGGLVPCLEINYLFFLIIPLMYAVGSLKQYMTILASMLLHELGHLTTALLTGRRVLTLKILPVGFNLAMEECGHGKWDDIFILLSGPLVNILILLLCTAAVNARCLPSTDHMRFFISSNAYLLVFNLMPVVPLDGGRLLQKILSERLGIFIGARYAGKAAAAVSVLLIAAGGVQLAGNLYNFSLLVIGIYVLFSSRTNRMEAAMLNMKQIIYRRSRLLKKGIYVARDLVVVQSTPIGEIVRSMDFDRFHIIHVLDDALKVCGVFSEQEVMDALLKYDNGMTFGELVRLRIET